MTKSQRLTHLLEQRPQLAPDQEITLPPKYYTFKRDEWYLLYDPVNVTWVRVNIDGLKIVQALAKFRTIENLSDHLAAESPDTLLDLEELKRRVSEFLSYLILVGFLHVGPYEAHDFPFFCQEKPTDVYLLMEYQCNLRCKYCYNKSDREQFNAEALDYLSFKDYTDLIEEMNDMGIPKVIFTGGEPLLSPLTLKVAAFARQKGLTTELITNGQLIERKNMKDLSAAFDIITVSLDSCDPDIHDQWRGKGTHARATQAIRKMKDHGLSVRVNSVICKHNVSTLVETWGFAVSELGVNYYTPALYTPSMGTEEEIEEMLPNMQELISQQNKARSIFNNKIGVAVKTAKFRFSCGIANGEISIGPDGTVFPCHTLHKPELACGNIRDHGLQHILENSATIDKLKKFRVTDIEKCRECDFKYLCGGGCLAMNYNMFGHFGKERNIYCNQLKLEQIERMWTSTTLGLTTARTSHSVPNGDVS